jgi:hypothetical protein
LSKRSFCFSTYSTNLRSGTERYAPKILIKRLEEDSPRAASCSNW